MWVFQYTGKITEFSNLGLLRANDAYFWKNKQVIRSTPLKQCAYKEMNLKKGSPVIRIVSRLRKSDVRSEFDWFAFKKNVL